MNILAYKDYTITNLLMEDIFFKPLIDRFLYKCLIALIFFILGDTLFIINCECSKIIAYVCMTLCFFVGCIALCSYNYQVNKYLKDHYDGYPFKISSSLFKINWDNLSLFKVWKQKIVEKAHSTNVSRKDIEDSLDYYKYTEIKDNPIVLLRILINILSFLSTIITIIIRFFNNETLFIVLFNIIGITSLVNIFIINYEQRKEEFKNKNKKMQFVCEYLLKAYPCNSYET